MGGRIVVVNDDPDIVEMIVLLLECEGYAAIPLLESSQVVQVVTEHQPDLVIQDIRMEQPDSGWRVIDALRRAAPTQQIPVLILSAERNLQQHATQLQLNHCDVLPTPFDPDVLVRKIHALIGPPVT